MAAVEKIWHLVQHDRFAMERLARELQASPVIAQLLFNRGVRNAVDGRRFLDAPLKGLHPPQTLPGVPAAVERLYSAIQDKRRVCIYGDYDADGVTGTAILLGLFQLLGAPAEFYVPHRLDEGYGLNVEALRQLASTGVKVVVTVDCGIASLEEADEAKRLGIELIVTDHHEMKDRLPDAAVCVHPRLPGTSYPFGGLSGAGVAYKLAWALAVRHCGSEKVTDRIRNYLLDSLCLATLGLIADVVPLHDENRILVRCGLDRMQNRPPLGVKALVETCRASSENANMRAEDVAFKLAPRLNAAGRLGCARLVVELLTTANTAKARDLATFLDAQNTERQSVERKMVAQAKDLYDAQCQGAPAVVLWHPEWHPGVVGIVAGRMVEHSGRPAFLFAAKSDQSIYAGSGRSIPGLELHQALRACDDLLLGHGGHAMAAGAKIVPEKLEEFRTRFEQYVRDHFPGGEPPAPRIRLDAEVPLSALTFGLLDEIDRLEPYGADNPKPKFLAGGLQIVGEPKVMGVDGRHLNFRLAQGETKIRAVGWGMGSRLEELKSGGGHCCVAFTPRKNDFQGRTSIEVEVHDFQPNEVAKLG